MADRVYARSDGKSRTKQADAEAADINRLMARYVRTGLIPQKGQEPRYGDFASGLDYHAALNSVRDAEEGFNNLPAHIRKHVDNDPGKFLDLVLTQEGRDELDQLGMVGDFAPPGAPDPTPPPAPGTEPPKEPEVPA